MYEQHLLAYRSDEESKMVYQLSGRQFLWWAAGALISTNLSQTLPPIPNIGYWGYFPYWIPFIIGVVFAHGKHFSTGLNLGKYLLLWIACRRRKREYLS